MFTSPHAALQVREVLIHIGGHAHIRCSVLCGRIHYKYRYKYCHKYQPKKSHKSDKSIIENYHICTTTPPQLHHNFILETTTYAFHSVEGHNGIRERENSRWDTAVKTICVLLLIIFWLVNSRLKGSDRFPSDGIAN